VLLEIFRAKHLGQHETYDSFHPGRLLRSPADRRHIADIRERPCLALLDSVYHHDRTGMLLRSNNFVLAPDAQRICIGIGYDVNFMAPIDQPTS
jgi:hypothetical protein